MTLQAEWYERAQCRWERTDVNDFFPETFPTAAHKDWMRDTCSRCEVWRTCRLAGLAEAFGWWGGANTSEREEVRRAASRGQTIDRVEVQVAEALRQGTWEQALALLTRHGWDARHLSLHAYNYLPHVRLGSRVRFEYRDAPPPLTELPEADEIPDSDLSLAYVGTA